MSNIDDKMILDDYDNNKNIMIYPINKIIALIKNKKIKLNFKKYQKPSDKNELKDLFNELNSLNYNIPDNKIIYLINKFNNYDKIVDYFTYDHRLKCAKDKLYNETFNFIRNTIKYYNKIDKNSLENTINISLNECKNIPLMVAHSILKTLKSNIVFDVCINNLGEFLIASIGLNIKVYDHTIYVNLENKMKLIYDMLISNAKTKIQNVDKCDTLIVNSEVPHIENYITKLNVNGYFIDINNTYYDIEKLGLKYFNSIYYGKNKYHLKEIKIYQKVLEIDKKHFDKYIKYKNKYLDLKDKSALANSNTSSDNKVNNKVNNEIEKILNPELVTKQIVVDDRRFNVVRDDELVGGTKQRMLGKIMLSTTYKEYVYAGPVYGYAQVALAYAAKLLNRIGVLFLETKEPRWNLTKLALKYKPKLFEVGKFANLKKVQNAAKNYVIDMNKKNGNDYAYLIPFGLNSKEFINILADQIKNALPNNLRKNPPKRFWLVAGSATLLNALYIVFPKTFFSIIQVGKTVWEDQLDLTRTDHYVSDEKFYNVAKEQPPYETVSTYDAKAWKYINKFGMDGDYIWNVGKDISI